MRYVILASLALAACAANPAQPGVVVDTARTLRAGEMVSYKLEPGRYRLELTASHDGVRVEWLGAACLQAKLIKQLSTECELKQTGQLLLENPSVLNLGIGKSISATVKLVRLP